MYMVWLCRLTDSVVGGRGRLVRKGGEVQLKFKYYCRFAVYIRAIDMYGMVM